MVYVLNGVIQMRREAQFARTKSDMYTALCQGSINFTITLRLFMRDKDER